MYIEGIVIVKYFWFPTPWCSAIKYSNNIFYINNICKSKGTISMLSWDKTHCCCKIFYVWCVLRNKWFIRFVLSICIPQRKHLQYRSKRVAVIWLRLYLLFYMNNGYSTLSGILSVHTFKTKFKKVFPP